MYIVDTKTIFGNALLELLAGTAINCISVRQITEICGLSSRSFYNYFADKFDLMNYVYYCANESCWFENGRPCSLIGGYTNWKNRNHWPAEVWINMYKYVGQNDIREFIIKKTKSDLRRLFIWNGYSELLDRQDSMAIVDFTAHGLSSLMEHSVNTLDLNIPDAGLLISCIPEPQRSALISDPACSHYAQDIEIFNPQKSVWPPKLYI